MAPKRKIDDASESADSPLSVTSSEHTSPKRVLVEGVSLLQKMTLLDELCINSVRCLAAELPQIANSGHPGAPMGCAPMAHALFGYAMTYSSKHPSWPNRDRFVLSNGHACALQYCMLHLTGYDLSVSDLKQFRQLHSRTPGHPECYQTSGVEVCTGPLGQGISNAVGMALGVGHMSAKYNREGFPLFDHFVYCICGDGCLQEGVSAEASSLAGHLGLGHLIVLYDSNSITIDGSTHLSFTENVCDRYRAYGWHVQQVSDGDNSFLEILRCVENAKRVEDKPSFIEIRTTIGFGSTKQGSEKTHGAPLGVEDINQAKTKFGISHDDVGGGDRFYVSEEVRSFYSQRGQRGDSARAEWHKLFDKYCLSFPHEGAELRRRLFEAAESESGATDKSFTEIAWPDFSPESPAEATRALSGKCLNAACKVLPEIVGGSADLTGSNCSAIKSSGDIQKQCMDNRYIRFGVREHGMAAVANGLFAYGGFRPFAATFLNFVTYAWGAVRLSALAHFGVLYVGTHDSIELGEDGPTHQPIETIPLIRATPNMLLVRPADGKETVGAYQVWLRNRTRPTVLALCRSSVPHLQDTSCEGVLRGGYVLSELGGPTGEGRTQHAVQVVIGASGSELHIALNAANLLVAKGMHVRVVSMPCWKLFDEQGEEYKQAVLPSKADRQIVTTAYVEAASTFGWEKHFDIHIGMYSFGLSAPKNAVLQAFRFTPEAVADRILKERQKTSGVSTT